MILLIVNTSPFAPETVANPAVAEVVETSHAIELPVKEADVKVISPPEQTAVGLVKPRFLATGATVIFTGSA